MQRPTTFEIIPSAQRLIRSLRDLGYDPATALTDLVDNSVAAGATRVDIDMHFAGESSWVRIADNGCGMSEARLKEAMRFGTRRDYEDDDLGKFGLGLKSASLSQCRCLTVSTRTTPAGRLRTAQWDLDYVEATDRWEILCPPAHKVPLATEPLRDRAGTVVVWEDLDRVFRYRMPDGQRAQSDFERITNDVSAHLSMVFHRFLSGESHRSLPISICVNGVPLQPWDPFARDEAETMRLPLQKLRFVHDGQRHSVEIRPYVLPPESRFSSPASHRAAAGPRLWNRQQGFYLYRLDRMIQSGGWSRLRTPDEHSKLARVSIDLGPGAEELFELNVSKTQVRIPGPLRADLCAIASNVARLAQDVYRAPSPAMVSGNRPCSSRDPRVEAINGLVEMVVSATESIVRTELAGSARAENIVAALRRMQAGFAADLEAAIASQNTGASPAGAASFGA